jgi:probable phosphoglycerate mutase
MELILVRHAEPMEQQTSDGSPADPALSERGRGQARAVVTWLEQLDLDRILSSPALRARQTAEPLSRRSGLEVIVDDRLRDAHAEADRYVSLEAQKKSDPDAYRARVDDYQDSPRFTEISTRVNEALDEWAARCPGERVVVFCHGSVINVFAARVLGMAPRAFLEAGYASGHRFLISSAGIRSVQSLNETAYLLV